MTSWQRLHQLLAPHRGRLLIALGATTVGCLLNLPLPVLIRRLIDGATANATAACVLGLIGVFALQAAVNLVTTLLVGGVGLTVAHDLRHRLHAHLQRLDLAYFDRMPTGAILSRVMDDVAVVQALLTSHSVAVLADAGTAAILSTLLLWMSPLLFAVAMIVVPAYALSFRLFGKRLRTAAASVRERLDTVFGHLKGKFDGALVVKAHAREEAEMAEFATQLRAAHAPRLEADRINATVTNLSAALSGVGAALIFAVGAVQVARGNMTAGDVVAATALAGLLFAPVARLTDAGVVFNQAAASLARLGDILDQEPLVRDPISPARLGRVRGAVEFEHVTFGYRPGERVLRDVCLRVEPGMRIALVGPTGCGKTTLVNLLLRFYDPEAGEVRLDGVPIRRLALADLRRQIGVVTQQPVLFRQSLDDNIRFGAADADDDRVRSAARAALVDEFASRLPQGYATIIGEGGHKLSQGEQQRIAIARALCKDPALVVLDEATSSMDAAGEVLIRDALANLLRGRTAFVIAHRLATVMDADRIVLLDGGRVTQIGTHLELLAETSGMYRRLCLRQFAATAADCRTTIGHSIASGV